MRVELDVVELEVVAGVGVVADLGSEEHGPDLVIGGEGDGGGGGVGGDVAVPAAQEVGGLQEACVLVGERAVVEGVGEALGYEEIELGVDVHLDAEHVGGGEGMVGGDAASRRWLMRSTR